MSILDETRFVERFQFFNGQRLFASDLQGADDFNREMRWTHNRSLGQPGIGSGFAVYGKRNDREVVIGAGYAVDALGREAVLTSSVTLQVPPVAADEAGKPVFYDLAVSYPDDDALEETETREGICLPRGVVRRREVPVFCWIRLNDQRQPIDDRLKQDILTGMRLILARAEVFNCQLNADLTVSVRRDVRPPRLPYVVCGQESPTNWEILELSPPIDAGGNLFSSSVGLVSPFIPLVGLTATIDTSSAEFQITPVYSARIAGPRLLTIPDGDGSTQAIVEGLIDIAVAQAGPKKFTIEVVLLVQPFRQAFSATGVWQNADPNDEEIAAFLGLFSEWTVVWMGVES
jgi:hypothetical protein